VADDDRLYANIADPCLQMLRSVLPASSAIYVAGPLETGRSFYESGGEIDQAAIRRANHERMQAFVASLRARQDAPVIDPGLLRVADWPNPVYGRFFFAVICEFVKEARFLDGWEYSRGATGEFVLCVTRGIRCSAEAGGELRVETARSLISAAADRIECLGHDPARFRARLEALDAASLDQDSQRIA
jgi:hypothetical protein